MSDRPPNVMLEGKPMLEQAEAWQAYAGKLENQKTRLISGAKSAIQDWVEATDEDPKVPALALCVCDGGDRLVGLQPTVCGIHGLRRVLEGIAEEDQTVEQLKIQAEAARPITDQDLQELSGRAPDFPPDVNEIGIIHKDLRTGVLTPGCCVDKDCKPHTCMALPAGKTCGDCVHVGRCTLLFGIKPEATICDFYPRRFEAVS